MTFETEQAKISRTPVWTARLVMDQCSNTFGVNAGGSTCTATGTPCYYTYPTCKKQTVYVKGSRNLDLVLNTAPLAQTFPCLPYIDTVDPSPTEIKPEEGITVLGELKLKLLDDTPWPWANSNKPDPATGAMSATYSNAETQGTFWRNWLARNPNFRGRECQVYYGFAGDTFPTVHHMIFRGIIVDVNISEGECEIVVKDYLKKLDIKIPAQVGDAIKLTAIYNGGADMYLTDVSSMPHSGTVKIEDEFITYSNKSDSGKYLMNCTPGRFGTTASSHTIDTEVITAAVFANGDDGLGISADQCFLQLLCDYGLIPGNLLAGVDYGVTLGIDAAATGNISLLNLNSWPASGYAKIEDEVIKFGNSTGNATSFIIVDNETGPQDSDHNLIESPLKQWHFIKFATGAGDTSLDRFNIYLKRIGYVSGKIKAYLYSDNSGLPGNKLFNLGFGQIEYYNLSNYTYPIYFDKHVAVSAETTYWLAFHISIEAGTGTLTYALRADATTTEFKHCNGSTSLIDNPTVTGIAGYPLFLIEKSNDVYDAITGCVRGELNTTAETHTAGTPIYLLEVSDQVGRWLSSCLYRRILTEQKEISELLLELKRSTFASIWQGEDCLIHFKCAPVPDYAGQPPILTDAEHFADKSVKTETNEDYEDKSRDQVFALANEDERITRVTVMYNPSLVLSSPGEEPANYPNKYIYPDLTLEDVNYYGEVRERQQFAPWIYQEAEANILASNIMRRFKYGARFLNFKLELKDAPDLNTGDFLIAETALVVSATGAPLAQAFYEVISKKADGLGAWNYRAMIVAGGSADGGGITNPALISLSSMTEVFDSYGATEHGKYAWVCDGNNKCGAADEPGYSIS
jgi:hypothetical protein